MRRSENVSLWRSLWSRTIEVMQGASSRSVQVTGVLGLVAIFLLYYRRKKPGTPKRGHQVGSRGASHPQTVNSSVSNSQEPVRQTKGQVGYQKPDSRSRSTSDGIRTLLGGIRKITISAPGVLLQQSSAQELEGGATLRAGVREVLLEVLQNSEVYIIAQVSSDAAEASCRETFQSEGLVGPGGALIPQQRLLFCSTQEGKTSIVRQIEPNVHFDGDSGTIEALKRFVKLVHITRPGEASAGRGSSNVSSAGSFLSFFSS